MKISVFTDASVIEDYCGYAFYIGCVHGKIQKAGKLRQRTNDIAIAELWCIANAMHTLKHSKFVPISIVWLYTDRIDVINALTGKSRGYANLELRKVVDEIHFLMMEICLREGRSIRDIDKMFEINHVKAHTDSQDKISIINQWCDENARKYARESQPSKKRKSLNK